MLLVVFFKSYVESSKIFFLGIPRQSPRLQQQQQYSSVVWPALVLFYAISSFFFGCLRLNMIDSIEFELEASSL